MTKTSTKTKPYRPCVGIALFNKEGKVFVGERHDTPGAWQMPQGGIDKNEEIIDAAYRELEEETGVSKDLVELIHVLDDPLYYDFPEHLTGKRIFDIFKGQKQHWVAFRFKGSDENIILDNHHQIEFKRWQWVPLYQTIDLIVDFKKDLYTQIEQQFRLLI